jgi:hypothetical protein
MKRKDIRIVPVLSLFKEVDGEVKPTPQFYKWPLLGSVIMAFQMTDNQTVTVTPKFVDKKGNAASVDGAPTWLVDNPNVLALAPAADGLSCVVTAVGPLGTGKVSVSADGDLGTGTTSISGSLDITIVGSGAVTVTLEPGTPADQP